MLKLPVQIRFNDMDGVGHLNNNVFGEFFDLGRLHYFEQALNEQVDWRRGKVMVLVHTEADFLDQVFLYDKIEVHTRVMEIGNRSLKMYQRIVDTKSGKIKAEGRSVLSTYDFSTGQSFPMLDSWREKIAAFEEKIK